MNLLLGFGIFTSTDICNKAFIMQYPGEMMSCSRGRELECSYPPHLEQCVLQLPSALHASDLKFFDQIFILIVTII